MYAHPAAGVSGTILMRVPWVPTEDSLIPPAALCYSRAEKENIPKDMPFSSHLSRTAAATYSNPRPPHGNAPVCPQPRVLNPKRLKHIEIDETMQLSLDSMENRCQADKFLKRLYKFTLNSLLLSSFSLCPSLWALTWMWTLRVVFWFLLQYYLCVCVRSWMNLCYGVGL